MKLADRPALEQVLLNDWQRGFPLSSAPFAEVARQSGHGCTEAQVLATYRRLCRDGSVSRIGGVWGAGAGGAAMLCALAVPNERLQAVARQVNAIPGVNHNYEREHRYNLWFVITGRDRLGVHEQVDVLDATTQLRTLRLPMVRPYRIDLGFDLRRTALPGHLPLSHQPRSAPPVPTMPVAVQDEPLAALVEEGLPLLARPYDAWAEALGQPTVQIQQTLSRWLAHGTLRRFGAVVRHHDLGICANAMTVLNVPDEVVDAAGTRLAAQSGVTLCYRRLRDGDWPYNLYFMVHGHDRHAVYDTIEQAVRLAHLGKHPRQTLFSGQRFKQTGGSYFRGPTTAAGKEAPYGQAA